MSDTNAHSQVITINGEEVELSQVEELYTVGKTTRDLETKYNTSLDKVWPAYGQSREQIKSLSQERDAALAELQSFRSKSQEGNATAQDFKDAKEAAKSLSPEDLEKAGFIKKDQLDSYFEEKYNSKRQQDQAVESVLQKAGDLEKEIDGSDGRPKFNKRAVIAYASAYGFNDLGEAYEDMHKDAIESWKEEQVARQTKKGLNTMKSGGAKEPNQPKVNRDNLGSTLGEALFGNNE